MDESKDVGKRNFTSPALDEFIAKMFLKAHSASPADRSMPSPTPPRTIVIVMVPTAENNSPHLQIQLRFEFKKPKDAGGIAQEAESILEGVHRNRSVIKTPAEAPDYDVQEEKRETEVLELETILVLLKARKEGKGLKVSLRATEKVGEFDVVRLLVNPLPPGELPKPSW